MFLRIKRSQSDSVVSPQYVYRICLLRNESVQLLNQRFKSPFSKLCHPTFRFYDRKITRYKVDSMIQTTHLTAAFAFYFPFKS